MGALPANLSIGRMIRVLALLCLAVLSMGEPEAEAKAVADPKADPYLLYGGYYGLGHHYGYGGYPSYRVYGKRSAEAEAEAEPAPEAEAKAEADPWYGYYGGYGHGYYGGHGLGYYGRYYGGHYGYPYYGVYGKRSAEAAPEAKAKAEADPWYGYYGGYGLGHYGRYYGGHYGSPYGGYYGSMARGLLKLPLRLRPRLK